jgi:polyhydroxyalkanoate synthase
MKRYSAYLAGIKIYRAQSCTSSSMPESTAPTIMATAGSSRLYDYAPAMKSAPVILVIPSLINRATILDISPEFSLVRWLVQQNIRPLLVDWGVPGQDERGMTISDYITRLQQFVPIIQQNNPARRCHLLGHCLGGNLALALAATLPQHFSSLMLLSTPWDFHADSPALARSATRMWQQLAPHLSQKDEQPPFIPAAMVQSLFALLQPQTVAEKFRQLALRSQSPERLQHFARVESWLNHGVPLPAAVMRELVEDWYGDNLPLRGAWRVNNQLIRPRTIKLPTLIAIPDEDHIVPPASSAALARQLPCATAWHVPLGHIGMIVSRRAKARVWRKLADWINHHTE